MQIAVAKGTSQLDESLRRAGAIENDDSVDWACPRVEDNFAEYRDGAALQCLGVAKLPARHLSDFWPNRGPVWDALGRSKHGRLILVEAKAHVPEAASPGTRASESSIELIRRSLNEARGHYAPQATADWSGNLYQYANRLAFHYLLSHLNQLPSRLVFLDFVHASDVQGPESEDEWRGATRLMHALLGLPADLGRFGVFHAYVDVRRLTSLL